MKSRPPTKQIPRVAFWLAALVLVPLGLRAEIPFPNASVAGKSVPANGSSMFLAAVSASGDVVGKLTVGYQGWFSCKGDGSPLGRWFHWGGAPEPGKISFEIWPDVREFTKTYDTGFAALGNGSPAKLFSSYDDQVVQTHFRWMRENGIDCAALQRFGSELGIPPIKAQRDGMARKVRAAAEATGRKFYVMYDLSGWKDFPMAIKADWTKTMLDDQAITKSPAYARQGGKPVVCIWGIGFDDRLGNVSAWLDVIKWFKSQGCYVIAGVNSGWRKQTELMPVFDACDMLSPWTVGGYRWPSEIQAHRKRQAEDLAYLDARGIAYQPVLFPGFAWSNWNGGDRNAFPRRHGDFLWEQFINLRILGIKTAYVAMFDEFDEGTAVAKAAEDASMAPGDQYFLTLDAEGVDCSSDFYLRLVRDGARMIKGLSPAEAVHPTPHREPTFMLISALDGRVVEMTKGPAGIRISLARGEGRSSQQFRFDRTDDGHFRMVPPSGEPGRDDAGGRWDFVPVSGGWLKLRNVRSGQVLEMATSGAGITLQPAPDNGSNHQRWRIVPVGACGIRIADGRGLRTTDDGARTEPADLKNFPAFRWRFADAGGAGLAMASESTSRVLSGDRASNPAAPAVLIDDLRRATPLNLLPLPNGRFKLLSGVGDAVQMTPDAGLEIRPVADTPAQEFVLEGGKENVPDKGSSAPEEKTEGQKIATPPRPSSAP